MSVPQAENVICPRCSTPNPASFEFCGSCGLPLDPTVNRQVRESLPPTAGLPFSPSPIPSSGRSLPPQPARAFIPQMGELTGAGCLGPFSGKGPQVDAWADVIEGMAAKAPEVVQAFDGQIQNKQIPSSDIRSESLTAPGVGAERRIYRMIRRMPALMAVYIAGLGSDLYVSWRLFVKTPISWMRVAVWLGIAGVFSLCSPLGGSCLLLYEIIADLRMVLNQGIAGLVGILGALLIFLVSFIISTIVIALILGVIAAVLGLRVSGDPFYLWRIPLNEFHEDDVAALSLSVHKALLNAVDYVGIDAKLLRAKEHFGVARGRLI